MKLSLITLSSLLHLAAHTTTAATIPPPPSTLSKRTGATIADCDSTHASLLSSAFNNCALMAGRARDELRSGSNLARAERFFKTRDPTILAQVADRYDAISHACADGTLSAKCIFDDASLCSGEINCRADAQTNTVLVCRRFFGEPVVPERCTNVNQAGLMIHEASHMGRVVRGEEGSGTSDFAYVHGVFGLSEEEAVWNADSYQMFSSEVEFPC